MRPTTVSSIEATGRKIVSEMNETLSPLFKIINFGQNLPGDLGSYCAATSACSDSTLVSPVSTVADNLCDEESLPLSSSSHRENTTEGRRIAADSPYSHTTGSRREPHVVRRRMRVGMKQDGSPVGVSYCARQSAYLAFYYDGGRRRSKSFNVRQHGRRRAKTMAAKFRQDVMRQTLGLAVCEAVAD